MNTPEGIYVEIRIRAPMDDLWQKTQDPALHQRWDLRFGEIRYLPREDDALPQQFVYAMTIAGIRVDGRGETAGERQREDGSRTSALKFWSDHPLSPIKKGSGYWKYVPTEDGIRFLTWYDYTVRWGGFGAQIDRLVLRPLMGWGTAWSFDRLRIWVEDGQRPEVTLKRTMIHRGALISSGLAGLAVAGGARRRRRAFPGTASVAALGLVVAAALSREGNATARRCLRAPTGK